MPNPTGQQIITNALTYLGINEQGGVPNTSDSNAALEILNSTWDGWGIDEGLIYAVTTTQYALTSGTGSYSFGPTGVAPFNVTPPSRIYKAVFVSATNRTPLRIVSQEEYFSHGDLAAAAKQPEEVYYDWNLAPGTGNGTIYLWPVQNVAGSNLELETANKFVAWALGTAYFIPPGYQDAIEWVLAFKCLPMFGVAVSQAVAQMVTANALKGEARLREMNALNRKLTIPAVISPEIQTSPQAAQAALQQR